MSFFTPSHTLIALVAILVCVIAVVIGADLFLAEESRIMNATEWLRALTRVMGHSIDVSPVLEYADGDEWEDDAYHGDFSVDPEKAVEIDRPVEYGPVTFEIADMTLRLTKPHLYSANWYQEWRRDFSQWVAEQEYLRIQGRLECGLAA